MKITGPGGVSRPGAASSARPAGAGGFKVSGGASSETTAAGRLAGPATVASVDALLAMQEADGPLERRRRSVKRASRMLDVLDEVKLALLSGETPGPILQRLAQAMRDQRSDTEDQALEGVLDEIETRAAVEMAKAEMSRLAA